MDVSRPRKAAEMSHIKCEECGSREHYVGYGLAFGGCGSYTVCECGELLEYRHDPEDAALDSQKETT